MILYNHYWCFKSALSSKFCDEVIKYALLQKEHMGLVGQYSEKTNLNKEDKKNVIKKRNSNVVWLDENWIYKEIHPYINIANKSAGWNFQWNRSQVAQFTKYKLNQYYDWHCDSFHTPYTDPKSPDHGKIRKLSIACQLTDGSEYKGGELEFDFRNYDPHIRDESKHVQQDKEMLSKGSIVVFPSFVWHRVRPVTAGTRYSVVLWNTGDPYK